MDQTKQQTTGFNWNEIMGLSPANLNSYMYNYSDVTALAGANNDLSNLHCIIILLDLTENRVLTNLARVNVTSVTVPPQQTATVSQAPSTTSTL